LDIQEEQKQGEVKELDEVESKDSGSFDYEAFLGGWR
jgi:hypothetical protein